VSSSPKEPGHATAARTGSAFSVIFAGQGRSNGLTAPNDRHWPPRAPHPAANRLVQSAFLIGFALRKALSILMSCQIMTFAFSGAEVLHRQLHDLLARFMQGFGPVAIDGSAVLAYDHDAIPSGRADPLRAQVLETDRESCW
jgi:hypothetical protein